MSAFAVADQAIGQGVRVTTEGCRQSLLESECRGDGPGVGDGGRFAVVSLSVQTGRIHTQGCSQPFPAVDNVGVKCAYRAGLYGRSFWGRAWPDCASAPTSTSTCRWMLCEDAG